MIKLNLNFARTGDYSSNVAPTWNMLFFVNGVMFHMPVSHAAAAEMLNKQVEKQFHSEDGLVCYTFTPDTTEPVEAGMSSEHLNWEEGTLR